MNLSWINRWPINYLSWFGTLAVAPLSRSVSGASGQTQFQIVSNRAWSVSSNSEWAVPDKTNGSGNDVVTITYAKNTWWMPREAVITVASPRTRPTSVERTVYQMQLIPNVLGLTEAVAIETMVEAGYSLWPTETYYHPCVPAGIVIAQSPVGSTPGMPGDIVTIRVSLGRAPAVVPDVTGLHFSLAAAALDAVGLVPEVEAEFSEDVAPGYVRSQDPEADTVLLEGDTVNVVVSIGVELTTVPDVVGLDKVAAENALLAAHLTYTIIKAYSETVAPGIVISQEIAPDTAVPRWTAIEIVVSRGHDPQEGDLINDLQWLSEALANSLAFQAWVGAENSYEAETHIAYFSETTEKLPLAVVAYGSWTRETITLDQSFLTTPQVTVEFAQTTEKSATNREAFTELLTAVGNIMTDLEAQRIYLVRAWQPDSEQTPTRTKSSAGQDIITIRLAIDGTDRS